MSWYCVLNKTRRTEPCPWPYLYLSPSLINSASFGLANSKCREFISQTSQILCPHFYFDPWFLMCLLPSTCPSFLPSMLFFMTWFFCPLTSPLTFLIYPNTFWSFSHFLYLSLLLHEDKPFSAGKAFKILEQNEVTEKMLAPIKVQDTLWGSAGILRKGEGKLNFK